MINNCFNCSLGPTHWAAPEEYFPAAPCKEQFVTESSTSPGTCQQGIPAGKTPQCIWWCGCFRGWGRWVQQRKHQDFQQCSTSVLSRKLKNPSIFRKETYSQGHRRRCWTSSLARYNVIFYQRVLDKISNKLQTGKRFRRRFNFHLIWMVSRLKLRKIFIPEKGNIAFLC